MDKILGFLSPIIVYAIIFVLHAVLPARHVTGYATKTNSTEKLRYRLNGLLILFTMVALWFAMGYTGLLPFDWFYIYRWYGLAGAITFGLIFSLFIVLPYPPVKQNFAADFYLGRLENPQWRNGLIDAKMWLYLVGAVMLQLNVLSFSYYHWQHFTGGGEGYFLAAALLTFFIVDYLTFEEVHLYTYDFFAERVGFKLGWGCIAFYPYFYSVPLWATAGVDNAATPVWLLVIYALVFFTGWGLSRGANLQKYYFKKDPQQVFLGLTPQTITDGKRTLLVSGFWGLSRHINYLGEILMATGVVLCTGHPLCIWPWLYPLYYVVLLFPRQADDDKRCAAKYGPLWATYLQRVPYRIIPLVY